MRDRRSSLILRIAVGALCATALSIALTPGAGALGWVGDGYDGFLPLSYAGDGFGFSDPFGASYGYGYGPGYYDPYGNFGGYGGYGYGGYGGLGVRVGCAVDAVSVSPAAVRSVGHALGRVAMADAAVPQGAYDGAYGMSAARGLDPVIGLPLGAGGLGYGGVPTMQVTVTSPANATMPGSWGVAQERGNCDLMRSLGVGIPNAETLAVDPLAAMRSP